MVLLGIAAVVVWIFVWLLVASRIIRRDDIGGGGKILWIVVILVIPDRRAASSTSSGTPRGHGRRRGNEAEGEGFEPSRRLAPLTVFETAPFDRSGTPPREA